MFATSGGPLSKFRSYTILALIGWTAVAFSLIWINWDWAQKNIQIILISLAAIWALGLLGIYMTFNDLKKHFQERRN